MKKVGIWLKYGYYANKGGGFSYYDSLMTRLQINLFSEFELCFINPGQEPVSGSKIETISLCVIPDKFPGLKKLIKYIPILQKIIYKINIKLFGRFYANKLKNSGVDLIYYIIQGDEILPEFPYVFTIWDMGYFVTYPFPELVQKRNFEGRRRIFNNTLLKALLVFAESEAGKHDLIKYANISEEKIRVVPIFAGNVINLSVPIDDQQTILCDNNLQKEKYFFYPAQYWAHKNHITLLHAFSDFLNTYPEYKLVLTGGDKGNKSHVMNTCKKLNIEKSVIFMGFVKNEEIYTLYKNATALIMASFFGPTNMPPIEAMNLGCPVICTNISGHKEIMAEAALYFNPIDSLCLTNAMIQMVCEHDKYRNLTLDRAKSSVFNVDNAVKCIDTYLSEALKIRSTWS